MDKYLKYDVMKGRELLRQGYSLIIYPQKLSIYKAKLINVVTESRTFEDCLNENDELVRTDRVRLINVFKPYMEHFIHGVPNNNTGQLEICLTDPKKTVQSHPHRPSIDEKETVR